jgi:hypothetical protein
MADDWRRGRSRWSLILFTFAPVNTATVAGFSDIPVGDCADSVIG